MGVHTKIQVNLDHISKDRKVTASCLVGWSQVGGHSDCPSLILPCSSYRPQWHSKEVRTKTMQLNFRSLESQPASQKREKLRSVVCFSSQVNGGHSDCPSLI